MPIARVDGLHTHCIIYGTMLIGPSGVLSIKRYHRYKLFTQPCLVKTAAGIEIASLVFDKAVLFDSLF